MCVKQRFQGFQGGAPRVTHMCIYVHMHTLHACSCPRGTPQILGSQGKCKPAIPATFGASWICTRGALKSFQQVAWRLKPLALGLKCLLLSEIAWDDAQLRAEASRSARHETGVPGQRAAPWAAAAALVPQPTLETSARVGRGPCTAYQAAHDADTVSWQLLQLLAQKERFTA